MLHARPNQPAILPEVAMLRRAVLKSNFAKTSDTTFAVIGNLFLPLGINETWLLRGVLYVDASQTGDIKVRVQATGATGVAGMWGMSPLPAVSNASSTAASLFPVTATALAATSGAALSGGGVGAGLFQRIDLSGYIVTSTTPGRLDVQGAQNTSDTTPTTFYAGSYIELLRDV